MATAEKHPHPDTVEELAGQENSHDRRTTRSCSDERRLRDTLDRLDLTITQIADNLKNVSRTCLQLERSLKFSQSDIVDLQAENADMKTENTSLKARITTLEQTTRDLERRVTGNEQNIAFNDNKARKRNAIIEGIVEQAGEIPAARVTDILCRVDQQLGRDEIDIAYRVGKPTHQLTPRPILVTFTRLSTKERLMSLKPTMRRIPDMKGIWINEDLNPIVSQQKSEIRTTVNILAEAGHNARVKGQGAVINSVYYTHRDLTRLPPNIESDNTRTKKVANQTAFASEKAPLSNLYRCNLQVNGRKFVSVEQAFQYAKAEYARDFTTAQSILDTDDPYIAKQLGKAIRCPEWLARREEVIQNLMKEKFLQNPHLREKLLESHNDTLVEATGDPYWGAGCGLTSYLLKNKTYKGRNITGRLLQDIRTELRAGAQSGNRENPLNNGQQGAERLTVG